MKKSLLILILLFIISLIVGCNAETTSENNNDQKETNDGVQNEDDESEDENDAGGVLKIGWNSLPSALDPHITTDSGPRNIGPNIFETLVTVNANNEIEPMLAESYEISDDGKIITFLLREGVQFHNGEEMKAEDVVASMQRWQEFSSAAKSELGESTWEAADEYTVILNVENPSYVLVESLAVLTQFPAIMPKEIIEAADETGVKEYVGTGPFKFEELKQDQYIKLVKFDNYTPLSNTSGGLAGKKEALVDELYFYHVPDTATRVSGLISGEYDVIPEVELDAVPQLESSNEVNLMHATIGIETINFNKQKGLFTDVRARDAVNLAIDKEAIMTSILTNSDYFELDPSLVTKVNTTWYSDAGMDEYEKYDPDEAKKLLEEVGYDGEEIRIIVTKESMFQYQGAIPLQEQLQNIGMNVKLDIMDYPTWLDNRKDPDKWELVIHSWSPQPTPLQYLFLDSKADYPGWTNSAEIDEHLKNIRASQTQESAKEEYEKLQTTFWKEKPVIVVGHYSQLDALSNKVEGYEMFMNVPIFWNTSIED
ncbi:ABC transporter substrate-binding protein [Ornithinibacillus sp. 4-3]|uniref:ABC transporter substrate-binding protein n=1 Tax=Ornithinibacillus sp. 4-3 TaxID=3231488 RepID=A0AB39HME0_9BACI